MPFDGNGNFSPPSPAYPAIAGALIEAAKWNDIVSDLASGMSNVVTRDGQSPPTANLPMGGKKLVNLGDGSSTADAVAYGQVFSGALVLLDGMQAVTPSAGDNSAKIATTEFVMDQSFSAVLPGQAGNAGKFITTDGASASWAALTAALVSYDGGTVDTILAGAKTLATYTTVRAYSGVTTTIRVTGTLGTAMPQGIAGVFQADPTDVVSADNGGTILVSTITGMRYKRVYSGAVNAAWFGADTTGVADCTVALTAAFNAVPAGGELLLPPGTFKTSGLNVTGKSVCVIGYGATMNCTAGTGSIIKTDHGNKLTVKGVSFIGSGSGINHTSALETSVYDELQVDDCTFTLTAGAWGVYSIGSREARFSKCTFHSSAGGNGIWFKDSVSPFMTNCIFKGAGYVGTAVNYPGSGNGTDCGLVLRDCEIMGWAQGVIVSSCDWLHISGCTIDYNTLNIKLLGNDGGIIEGNYLGSVGVNPSLWITDDIATGETTQKLKLIGNTFTGHYIGANYDCVLIDGVVSPDALQIVNNTITFYTRYGICFTMTNTRLNISDNHFAQRTGYGVSPVYNTLGGVDSGIQVKANYFANGATVAGMNLSTLCSDVYSNPGCLTERGASALITVGNTSIGPFAHGITGFVPAITDVYLTPANASAVTAGAYVSFIDATNITISTTLAVAGSTAQINYTISRKKI